MKIVVRTGSVNFSMPVPLGMADIAIKAMPDAAFERLRRKVGPPYDRLVRKAAISFIFSECREVFRENKGLEIVHVEGHDGTYVSIKL